MRSLNPFVLGSAASAAFLLVIPAVALAGGGASAPASPQPQPVRQTKVWTNDDLAALGPRFETTRQPTPVQAAPTAPAAASEASAAPLEPEQDPRWYAQELGALEDELASVSAQEERLRDIRETGSTAGTGLNVVAPCVGISTDNLIAMFAARRQEITQQIDALGDTARMAGMLPGILVAGRGRVSAEIPLTPGQQQAALLDRYVGLSDDLADTQDTVAVMHAAAASARMTLLQPDVRWGGNMTTNLLGSLYDHQSDLQSQLSDIQDQARNMGLQIEALR